MIKANSHITLYPDAIRQLTQAAVTALEKTAEELHTEVVQAQVMPFDKGNLQNESTFVDFSEASMGVVHISHNTPYARRLYYHPEYRFSKAENPRAGGEWWKDWLPGGDKEDHAAKVFAQFYKEETGV